MGKIKGLFLGSILLIAFIAGSCADLPKQEVEEAEAAVSQAENDPDAVLYGEPSLNRARKALSDMREAVSTKRYNVAKGLAQDAIKLAAQARTDGINGASRAQGEASRALSDVKNLMAETEQSLETAKNVGNLEADFESLEERLRSAGETIASAENDFANGNYPGTQEKSRAARFTLNGVSGELSTAVQVISRKK